MWCAIANDALDSGAGNDTVTGQGGVDEGSRRLVEEGTERFKAMLEPPGQVQ